MNSLLLKSESDYVRCIFLVVLNCSVFFACTRSADVDGRRISAGTFSRDSSEADNAWTFFMAGKNCAERNVKDSALYFYNKTREIFEKRQDTASTIITHHAIAEIYLADIKYDYAEQTLEKARMLMENADVSDSLRIKIYEDLATAKMELKDFPTAISLTQRTMSFVRSKDPADSITLAKGYRRLGDIYLYSGEFDKSVQYLQDAIDITNEHNHRELGRLYADLALMHSEKKEFRTAIRYCDLAIAHDEKWAGRESDDVAKRLLVKAYSYKFLGIHDSALTLLKKNLEIRRKENGEKDASTFGAKYSLGEYYYDLGEFSTSLEYYQGCLISLVDDFENMDWKSNPKPLVEDLNTDLIIGLVGKAKVLNTMARKDSNAVELLDISLKSLSLADSAFSIFRNNLVDHTPQWKQLETGYIPYDKMLSTCYQLIQKTNDVRYLTDAFKIMERSRSVILQNALNSASSFGAMGLPEELRQEERKLIGYRQAVLHQLEDSVFSSRRDSLYQVLLDLNNRQHELLNNIQKIAPQYVQAKYGDNADIEVLQDELRRRESVFLEFFWGRDSIYLLTVDEIRVHINSIAITPELLNAFNSVNAELLADQRTIFDKQRFTNFRVNAYVLYQKLLADVLKNYSSDSTPGLVICADGPLASFPFEVLLTEGPRGEMVDYRLPYLAMKYRTSYAFSAGTWISESDKDRQGSKVLAMGYSNKSSDSKSEFADLPGTVAEVKAIEDVMKGGDNMFLLGPTASESSFKKFAPECNILHMAIHGLADTTNALQSHLVFNETLGDSEDARLYAHELYDLNLSNLDFAVLSACESGIGKVQRGEGMMSIARGFAYAGCPSMTISLWKIDDVTTASIMANFYQNISSDQSLDEALQVAKKDYLSRANEFNSHPSFWAAFIQIGNSAPIRQSQFFYSVIWISLVLAVAGATFFYFRNDLRRLTRGQTP